MSGGINAAYFQELADELGVDAAYLEKDWVLSTIIRALAESALGEQLILKGGQALRHVYGSVRLSRDVDYIARKRFEFIELHETASSIRYPRLSFPDRPEGHTSHGFRVRPITYRSPLDRQDNRVELEVSFRGDAILPPDRAMYHSPYYEPFTVQVMNLNEMVTEKIRAMYQRGNPRDLYDLWFVFTQFSLRLDQDQIARLIPDKFRPPLVSGGWYKARLYDRLQQEAPAWDSTLGAYVATPPTFDEAFSIVEKGLRFLPQR